MIDYELPDNARKGLRRWRLRESAQISNPRCLIFRYTGSPSEALTKGGFSTVSLGAATGASPAPKVFTAQNGFETYANRFYLEWHDASAKEHVLELTPESYSGVTGPYNRRNVYGAVISYAPVLESNPLTRLMFRTVLTRSFCGKQPIIAELGVPADAARHGPLRIRLEPRRAPVKHGFRLVHEVRCDG